MYAVNLGQPSVVDHPEAAAAHDRQGAVLRVVAPDLGARRAGLDWAALGPRQRAVAEAVLAGETNAQIAARLDMSVHTVREHLKRMAGRLGARGRAGLILGLQRAQQHVHQLAPAAAGSEGGARGAARGDGEG